MADKDNARNQALALAKLAEQAERYEGASVIISRTPGAASLGGGCALPPLGGIRSCADATPRSRAWQRWCRT